MIIPSIALLLLLVSPTTAFPHSFPANLDSLPRSESEKRSPYVLPIQADHRRQFSPELEVRQAWLKGQARNLRRKYEEHLDERGLELMKRDREEEAEERRSFLERREEERLGKRASGSVTLTDIGLDASYSSYVTIGSSSQSFLVILDTGSSDLWVAGSACTSSSCSGITKFNPSSSSSLVSSSTAFNITYGSGEADGYLVQDSVSMGGFTVSGQTFAVVTSTSAQLISSPLSGLMGLGWKQLAASGVTPWWQSLAASGSWSDAEFGVYLGRYRNVTSARQVESQGGEIVFGGLNTTKYTGDLNYISLSSSRQNYWQVQVQGLTVQNTSVSINSPYSAIDTGTTLIGVPSSVISKIYAQIPGSQALSASSGYSGYYQYPCSTVVNVQFQFGGLSYAMTNADMNLGQFTRDTSMCTGAFFQMDLSSQSPISWIVGASFLKNVYTAFRYSPAAVGFAALSGSASTVSAGTVTTSAGTTSNTGTGKSSAAVASGMGAGSLVLGVMGVAGVLAAGL